MLVAQIPQNVIVAIVIGVIVVGVCLILGFWLWNLNDCLTNELPGSREKVSWTIVILVFGLFGAMVYNVSRRKQRIKELGK